MKQISINILLISMTLLTFGGCRKEAPDESSTSGRAELKFKLEFANPTLTQYPASNKANPNGTSEISTRVATDIDFRSQFEDTDQIGIFIVKHASGSNTSLGSVNFYNNIPLTYTAADQSYTTTEPLYYPTDGDVIDVYAYYPYNAIYSSPLAIAFSVDSDQSGSRYNTSDLIAGTPVMNVAKGETINLTFSHLLSMVEVQIPLIEGRYQPTSTTKVTLQNIVPTANLDLSTNNSMVDSQASTTNIIMHRVETVGTPEYTTRYTYRALLPAQTVAPGLRLLEIDTDGQIFYDPRITEPMVLDPGSVERQTRQLPPL